MCTIGVDLWGGDNGPATAAEAVALALPKLPSKTQIHLFGPEEQANILRSKFPQLKFTAAPQFISMAGEPQQELSTKTKNALLIGLTALANRQISGFASAGNSGAVLLAALQTVGLQHGFQRPALAAFIPTLSGEEHLLLDAGLNANCQALHLQQFAHLGSQYLKKRQREPRVYLLNNGLEANKGSRLQKKAYQLLQADKNLNFKGNLEPRDLYQGPAKIIVTDGYTGNLILKQAEALYLLAKSRNLEDDYFSLFNYENYGGAPILGLKDKVVLGHGAGNAKALKNMILTTARWAQGNL
jgi:glycerol-3-phosphate acyltransferase PlsX